jgi:hypothetical protein
MKPRQETAGVFLFVYQICTDLVGMFAACSPSIAINILNRREMCIKKSQKITENDPPPTSLDQLNYVQGKNL